MKPLDMPLNREAMLVYQPTDEVASYDADDTIFYALSIGLGADPTDTRALPFVQESNLTAFPTMAFVIGWSSVLSNPDFGIERGQQVVAGLGLEMHRSLPPLGRLKARNRIPFVSDAGKGALIRVQRMLSTEAGVAVATVDTDVFLRGAGGFSDRKETTERTPTPPDTPPDMTCDLPTRPDMALIYRLNGDRNPLHANPEFARRVGFDRPILHGQATFAIAVHGLVKSMIDYDVNRLRSVRARLVKPFYPGQTLRATFWSAGEQVLFRCSAVESDAVVIDNGVAVIGA